MPIVMRKSKLFENIKEKNMIKQIRAFVEKGVITPAQYEEITGERYE